MQGDYAGSGSVWGRWNSSVSAQAHPGAYACLNALANAARMFLAKKRRKDSPEHFASYLARCRRINTAPHSPRNLFRK